MTRRIGGLFLAGLLLVPWVGDSPARSAGEENVSLNPDNWPQFRGPGGTAVGAVSGLPDTWGPAENVRWKADLPGRGVSGPVVARGRVYVTACSGPRQERLHVLCFDAATGTKRWERQLWATGNTLCHPKTCMAAPTPVTDGARVYALFATGDLACFDADGDLVWYRALVQDYPTITNQVGMAASPVLWHDVLIVPMENLGDSCVLGLDRLTGANRWKEARARDINWVTPLLVRRGGRDEVLVQSAKELTAYDPGTGSRLWEFRPAALATIPSPVAGAGSVLLSGPQFLCVRLPDEGGRPEVAWKSARFKSGYVTPLDYQGRLYTVNPVSILVCADAATGKVRWQARLGLEGEVSASPVAADGKVYVTDEKGATAVVRVGDRPRVLAVNEVGEGVLATPALADGALFLRSDQHLFCIRRKQGN
jgi:outer membrane protein assembly factor BamB